MTKLLFSASLERHMAVYMQNVKLDELNQQYQLAQGQIVREGERMQLSQADIINKLDQLKADLQKRLEMTPATINDVPVSSANWPEIKKEVPKNKGTIVGLKEAIANPQLRKTTPKGTTVKPKSPMQQALEEAAGSPSRALARSKRKTNSPTASEAPTIESTMATSASDDIGEALDLPTVNFRSERKKLRDSINASDSMSVGKKKAALMELDKAKSVVKLNEIQSRLVDTPGYGGAGLKKRSNSLKARELALTPKAREFRSERKCK